MEQNFTIFGITSPVRNLKMIGDDFNQVKEFDYDEVEGWMSKQVYHHDIENDPKDNFDYRYFIEAYYSEEEDKTFYYLFLVPTFSSLSDKHKNDVADGLDPENVTETDVYDYGISLILAKQMTNGSFDKKYIDYAASVVPFIDRGIGFYLDRAQNRIGTTGWEMLDDYLNDVDFTKATLNRWEKSKE